MISTPRHRGRARLTSALFLLAAAFAGNNARAAAVFPIPRYGQAVALMPNGKVLVVGGVDGTGNPTTSVEILDTVRGSEYSTPAQTSAAAGLNFARSSATITVLPNGSILVTGGMGAGSAIRQDAEVYNPATNVWTLATNSMGSARVNHTATLLNTGNVLVCGGQSAAGAVTASCDLFTPSGTSGSFSPTGAMLQARALHTATLLGDGTVWVSGGWNPTLASPFVVTTERYSSVSGDWSSTGPLGTKRAYHTATLTGDGKVLVAGGYNDLSVADPTGFGASLGNLSSAELFDPSGGGMSNLAPLQARVQNHAAVLRPEGIISIYGGMGNIPTTVFNQTPTFDYGSSVTFSGGVRGGYGSSPLTFNLGTQVTGTIMDGDIEYVNPVLKFLPSGMAVTLTGVTSGTSANTALGLRTPLNGVTVGCSTTGGTQTCGLVSGDFQFSNMGQSTFDVSSSQNQQVSNMVTGAVAGQLFFNPSPISTTTINANVTNGSFYTRIKIPVPAFLAGRYITSVTLSLSNSYTAVWSEVNGYQVILTGGSGTGPGAGASSGTGLGGSYQVQTDGKGNYFIDIASFTFTAVTGTIQITAPAPASSYSLSSPVTIPVSGASLTSLNASMGFSADGVDLCTAVGSCATLSYDSAYVVIRKMMYGDNEFFAPKTNNWSYQPPNFTISRPGLALTGVSAIVTPSGDEFDIGGRTFNAVTSLLSPHSGASDGVSRLDAQTAWAPQSTDGHQGDLMLHAFHTATLLPDGTILVAGGTDGLNVLAAAEIFDPASGSFAMTASSMTVARQRHSANLLPNGRVLLAGGSSLPTGGTGPTNTTELFFPNTRFFLPGPVMISSHSQHAAVSLPNGNVFVAGGYNGLTQVSSYTEIYQSTTNTWIPAAFMPAGQQRAVAAAVQLQDGTIMLCGGINETGILSSVVVYNPATNAWTTVATDPMPSALHSHTATLLSDGRVLVAGGNAGYGETGSTYIYDPSAAAGSRWSSAWPMQMARYGHSATLMPNGTVMVSGGVYEAGLTGSSPTNARPNIEFFHVDFATWTYTTNLAAPRTFHTATLTPSGYVYIIGGANGNIGNNPRYYDTYESMYFTMQPDQYSVTPGLRQSAITSVTAVGSGAASPFMPGTAIEVKGQRFRGGTEASGGAAGPGNPSFNTPRLILQKVDGASAGGSGSSPGFVTDMTPSIYSYAGSPNNLATLNTDLKVTLPIVSSVPYGWYMTWVAANDIHSARAPLIQIGPTLPAAVGNLVATPVGVSSITFTWSSPGGSFDGYDIYSATTGIFIATVSAATPSYTQRGLAPNTTAQIVVAAYTASGDAPLTASATAYTFSVAPVSLAFSSVTFASLTLQWNANGNTPGTVYEISQSTDNFAASVTTPVPVGFGLTDTNYPVTGLAPSTTYYFRVRAFNNAAVASSFSVSVTTMTRGTVSGVNCGSNSSGDTTTSIQWSWTPGSPYSYNIYNATTGVLLGSVPGTVSTYRDTGLAINSQRAIMVTAITGAGESTLSPSATCYTLAATPGAGTPVMTSTEPTSFSLLWTNNGNPLGTSYSVSFNQSSSSNTAVITATTTSLGIYISNLAPSQPYTATISAVNSAGVLSQPLYAGTTYTLANPPASLTVLGTQPDRIAVSWDQNGNSTMTYYQVTYSRDGFAVDNNVFLSFSSRLNVTSTTITGLLTGTTYWIRVQAMNNFGHLTSFGNMVSTVTYNGGASAGSLAGVLTAVGESQFSGSLGDGTIFSLRAPPGAFPTDTTVTVSTYDTSGSGHGPLCPNGIVNGAGAQATALTITDDPGYQPAHPLYLTASYTPAQITGSLAKVSLSRYNADGSCTPLRTTFDPASNTYVVQLNHFSTYQLVSVPPATSASSARVFPNPYRAATDGYVSVDQIPPQSRVRIMTLRGETVLDATADGAGLLTWNGSNGAGRPVSSGLYLVVVEAGSGKKILKLAVIR